MAKPGSKGHGKSGHLSDCPCQKAPRRYFTFTFSTAMLLNITTMLLNPPIGQTDMISMMESSYCKKTDEACIHIPHILTHTIYICQYTISQSIHNVLQTLTAPFPVLYEYQHQIAFCCLASIIRQKNLIILFKFNLCYISGKMHSTQIYSILYFYCYMKDSN